MAKTIYCTIAAANYMPRVQILRDSLAKQGHTDFRVLLIEHPGRVRQMQNDLPDYHFVSPDDVGVPQWIHMAFYYNVMEYSTALKPGFIRSLLKDGNVVYLDPDIEVFSPLTEIEELLNTNEIVLTPHVSRPLPLDGHSPSMADIIRKGQFNLGFIGVQNTPAASQLMDWWQGTLVEGAFADDRTGSFTDQFWAAGLVSFAERAYILRSARYNLAYWNIGLHKLTWDGVQTPQTENGPLGFYHYSGLERSSISMISKHQSREKCAPGSPLFKLLTQYLNRVDQSPLNRQAKSPYSFGFYHTGEPVTNTDRLRFFRVAASNRRNILNPFAMPEYIRALGQSPSISQQDALMDLAIANQEIQHLRHTLHSLPYSLFGHLQFMMDKVAPGSWSRTYNLLQRTSSLLGPRVGQLRQLLR